MDRQPEGIRTLPSPNLVQVGSFSRRSQEFEKLSVGGVVAVGCWDETGHGRRSRGRSRRSPKTSWGCWTGRAAVVPEEEHSSVPQPVGRDECKTSHP